MVVLGLLSPTIGWAVTGDPLPTCAPAVEMCTALDADDPPTDEAAERRGCCSRHHGVCGCASSGMEQCCDGTESPSCGCRSKAG